MSGNQITDSTDCQQLSNQLCHRFYVIANAITRRYRAPLEKINLTYPQYVVMMALWEKDDISVRELQQKTLIDTGCLSVMLKKMIDKGLLERIACDMDRRIKKVKLTEKGVALKDSAQKVRKKLQQTHQPTLSDTELQQLIDLLDKLKAGLL